MKLYSWCRKVTLNEIRKQKRRKKKTSSKFEENICILSYKKSLKTEFDKMIKINTEIKMKNTAFTSTENIYEDMSSVRTFSQPFGIISDKSLNALILRAQQEVLKESDDYEIMCFNTENEDKFGTKGNDITIYEIFL